MMAALSGLNWVFKMRSVLKAWVHGGRTASAFRHVPQPRHPVLVLHNATLSRIV